MSSPILAPVVALVLWSFVMCAWLYATRLPAMFASNIKYDPRRPDAEFHAQLPAAVRWKADNYNHLMEQPTLFYAVALTLGAARRRRGSEQRPGLALCRRCGSSTASCRRPSTRSRSASSSSWRRRWCCWR